MSAYHLVCGMLMHKTQQKTALFVCSLVVDSCFFGYVVWIAVMSSRIYIQYFLSDSSLLTVGKYISHWRFSHSKFLLSTLLSVLAPVQTAFQRSPPVADLFYSCKWKYQLCEKSNTNKDILNSLGLEICVWPLYSRLSFLCVLPLWPYRLHKLVPLSSLLLSLAQVLAQGCLCQELTSGPHRGARADACAQTLLSTVWFLGLASRAWMFPIFGSGILKRVWCFGLV